MSKRRGQQTTSVVINVTPEELAAVKKALDTAQAEWGIQSRNGLMKRYLKLMCRDISVEWPEADTTLTEGRDNRGRFVKKE